MNYLAARRMVLQIALLAACLSGSSARAADTLLIKEVFVVGAKKTRDWVPLQEMPFRQGDRIAAADFPDMVKRAEQNIYNLNLFTEVRIAFDTLGGEAYVFVNLRERWFFIGAPFLELEERNSFDAVEALLARDLRRLSYGLSFSWKNMTGRNETLTFYGQAGFSRQFGLDFQRPSLFRKAQIDAHARIHLARNPEIIAGIQDGAVQWVRQQEGPAQRAVSGFVSLRKRFNLYQSLALRLGYRFTTVSDSVYSLQFDRGPARYFSGPQPLERYATWMLLYTADYRDVKAYPLQGWKAQVFARGTSPAAWGSSTFAKAGFTFSKFIPIQKRWNLGLGFQAISTLKDSLPFFEKSFIGLEYDDFPFIYTELRGYEPYGIGATSMAMAKAELKFALVPRQTFTLDFLPLPSLQRFPAGMYLTAFWDNGYLTDRSPSSHDARFQRQWLYGFGTGLNVVALYDFIFRIEFSVNRNGRAGIYLHSSLPIR